MYRIHDEALHKFHDVIRKCLSDIDPSLCDEDSNEDKFYIELIRQISPDQVVPDQAVGDGNAYDRLKAIVQAQLRDNLEQFLTLLSNDRLANLSVECVRCISV